MQYSRAMRWAFIAFLWLSLLVSAAIMFISVGWFLTAFFFAWFLVLITHAIIIFIGLAALPSTVGWLTTSSIMLIAMSLMRPDYDDVGTYTGYSALMRLLGLREGPYVQDATLMPYFAYVLLLALYVGTIISARRHDKRQRQQDGGKDQISI